MAGAENIINEIMQEARDKADGIVASANAEADAARAAAKKEYDAYVAKAKEAAEREAGEWAKRVESQTALRRRQATLAAKQEIIESVIDGAYARLAGQEDAEYFRMILTLVGKNAQKDEGEILFSEKDLTRLPEGFAKELAKAAEGAGGTLKISDTPAKIENGFILRYGGIDENCTLEALFAEKREALADRVREVLW